MLIFGAKTIFIKIVDPGFKSAIPGSFSIGKLRQSSCSAAGKAEGVPQARRCGKQTWF